MKNLVNIWEFTLKDIKAYEKDIQGYIGFKKIFKDI